MIEDAKTRTEDMPEEAAQAEWAGTGHSRSRLKGQGGRHRADWLGQHLRRPEGGCADSKSSRLKGEAHTFQ